ncbi:MAG: hypothetical protein L0G87_00950 [Renibacterium salmoninarum]|nr:hypothetical protein [Renibacterium salmoninarum]
MASGKSAILAIRIVTEAKDAQKGFNDASKSVEGFTQSMERAVLPAAAISASMIAFAATAGKAAATAEQNLGAVQTVFGDAANLITTASQQAAENVGLSASAYDQLAAKIGGSLKIAGYSTTEMADKTQNLIGVAADLSSVFGGTTAEAVDALGAALRGEFDPLERFGIFMKQSDVNARAAAMGLNLVNGSADAAASKQAALAIIMQQATPYMGNYANEADTAEGAQSRANASWEQAQAVLGQALLPLMVAGARALQQFAGFVSENAAVILPLIAVIGSLAAIVVVITGAMKAWEVATALYTVAQWLLNAALSANPIGLVIIAIAGLIAIVILAYNNVQWFRDGVDAAVQWIVSAWNSVVDALRPVVDWISAAINAVGQFLGMSGQAQANSNFSMTASYVRPFTDDGMELEAASGSILNVAASGGRLGGPAVAVPVTNNYFNIEAGYDPNAVAERVRGLMDGLDRTNGRRAFTGGARW